MIIYETRWAFLKPHILKKRVLDLGPAELVGTVNQQKLDRWLHGKMAREASHILGLEHNAEQVSALRESGYNIIQGNAEQFKLDEQFDVIVAGELIEHLSNPGIFLDCIQRHLCKDGKLLLTTPNRYSILALYYVLSSGQVPLYRKPIAKHVAYFDSDSLTSLLKRHGFSKITIDYCKWVGEPSTRRRDQWLVKIANRFRPVILPVLLATAHK